MTLLLLLFYLLFGRVLPWAIPVTCAVLLGRQPKLIHGFIVLFVIGLLDDVAHARSLGLSSLFLISISIVVWLIESQYRGKLMWWWFAMGMLTELLWEVIHGQPVSWWLLIGQLVTLLAIYWWQRKMMYPEGIYVGK